MDNFGRRCSNFLFQHNDYENDLEIKNHEFKKELQNELKVLQSNIDDKMSKIVHVETDSDKYFEFDVKFRNMEKNINTIKLECTQHFQALENKTEEFKKELQNDIRVLRSNIDDEISNKLPVDIGLEKDHEVDEKFRRIEQNIKAVKEDFYHGKIIRNINNELLNVNKRLTTLEQRTQPKQL